VQIWSYLTVLILLRPFFTRANYIVGMDDKENLQFFHILSSFYGHMYHFENYQLKKYNFLAIYQQVCIFNCQFKLINLSNLIISQVNQGPLIELITHLLSSSYRCDNSGWLCTQIVVNDNLKFKVNIINLIKYLHLKCKIVRLA